LLDYKIKEKNLTIKKTFSKRIPKILLDKEKMEQAIINILLNSIESLGEKGIIWITAKYKGNPKSDIALLFADNGPGINKKIAPYIFDPFFTKKKKGTGLGLANVKKVIEAHGGMVATGLLAEGFSLVITLPVNKK
jgi:signal transduction histidine kinase